MGKKFFRVLTKYIIPIFSIFFLMFMLFGGFKTGEVKGNEKPKKEVSFENYSVSPVIEKDIPVYTTLMGNTKPINKIFVSPRIVGRITSLYVFAGKRVKKGELLARIDDSEIKEKIAELNAKIAQVKVNMDQAYADYLRDKGLYENKVIPKIEFEHSTTKYESLKKEIGVLKKNIDVLKVELSYTYIYSPCNGVIIDKLAELGDMAVVGKPIASIYRSNRMWLEVNVPESLIRYVKLRDKIKYSIPSIGIKDLGIVDEIVPQGNPLSRTFLLRLKLKPDNRIIEGLYGEITLKAGMKKILLVDERAIYSFGQMKMVKVKKNGEFYPVIVILGKKRGNFYEVLSGLNLGDKVALLREGGEK